MTELAQHHPNKLLAAAALLAALATGGCGSSRGGGPQPQPEATGPLGPAHTAGAPAPPLGVGQVPAPTAVPADPAPSTVADLVERVAPAVVNITAVHKGRSVPGAMVDPFEFFFGRPVPGRPEGAIPHPRIPPRSAAGSGFIIGPEGYVVTNHHVVEGADELRVRLLDDRQFKAQVVGRDPKLDLALIKLENASGLPSVVFGSAEALRVGEHVLAVGNPFGLGHTVTMGIVSAKARTIGAGPYDDFIQTDASINPGNSGGPLFDLRGQVVGINTAIRAGADGIGFAIPIDALQNVMAQLKDKGYVERGKLGLAFQPVTDELAKALGMDRPRGALVNAVETGSAAERAGIAIGDVIVGIDDEPIDRAEELPRHVARHPPGSTIRVLLRRGGRELARTATLDKLEDEGAPPGRLKGGESKNEAKQVLGLEIADHPGGGVRVLGLSESAVRHGLRPGDIIVEVNRRPVRNVEHLAAALDRIPKGETALFKVQRRGHDYFVGVPLGE